MIDLPKISLGARGPELARLCLGTMMFGDQTGEPEAARILDAYLEDGGNVIDTADSYADGNSERMVGRLLRDRGVALHVATKTGNPVSEIDDQGGLSPERIAQAVELSRARLDREAIDLYYLHLDDNVTPLDEIVDALGRLIAKGTVRAWGFSNFRPWKIAEMIRVADRLGVDRPVASQPYYHLLNRTAEADYLPACAHFGIGVVSYSPLARGVLTGKYVGATPEGSRASRADKRFMETEFFPETLARAQRMAGRARETGRPPEAIAVRWLLANRYLTSVLAGPRTLEHYRGYASAFSIEYTAEDERFLSGLCAPGHVPAPEHNDPRYPLRGRVTEFDDVG